MMLENQILPGENMNLFAFERKTSMNKYIPSPREFVADQVERYEGSGGTTGWQWRDTDRPVILVIHRGRKTGAVRKTPLMRVKDGNNYVLVASLGGAPENPRWYYNLKANPDVQIRDKTDVHAMRVREVVDPAERERLWKIAVEVFPPYAEYQEKTERTIPLFVAEPVR
jgi:deazaflavin-dependent oxidoreductase (nitroreductase family)